MPSSNGENSNGSRVTNWQLLMLLNDVKNTMARLEERGQTTTDNIREIKGSISTNGSKLEEVFSRVRQVENKIEVITTGTRLGATEQQELRDMLPTLRVGTQWFTQYSPKDVLTMDEIAFVREGIKNKSRDEVDSVLDHRQVMFLVIAFVSSLVVGILIPLLTHFHVL